MSARVTQLEVRACAVEEAVSIGNMRMTPFDKVEVRQVGGAKPAHVLIEGCSCDLPRYQAPGMDINGLSVRRKPVGVAATGREVVAQE
jgi:hypothetical protein